MPVPQARRPEGDVRLPESGPRLPVFERLAPAPPSDVIAERIEALTRPGDVVVDLHGRGGWVARAAIDRQRRAVTIESSPLSRLLAELVLRPPDLRHLDAAFAAVGSAPHGESSVRQWIADRWATRCPTCDRTVALDELVWERSPTEPDGLAEPIRRTFRCPGCRAARLGPDVRHDEPDADDRARASSDVHDLDADAVAGRIRDRFPVLEPSGDLADELLRLHSPRQLAGLAAIIGRIEGDLRAAPVEAALRIAFLHAVLPASRLNGYPGRVGVLRIVNGRLRAATGATWRERNPWIAFEDGYRLVRSFIQRLESSPLPPVAARYAPDVRALADGGGSVVVRLGTPSAYRRLAEEPAPDTPRAPAVRLLVAIAPPRPRSERLSLAYHSTAWALGREAASLLPLEPLFGGPTRVPWGWQAAALRRSLAAAEPLVRATGDARSVAIVERSPEALVAAAIGAAGARYRLVEARPTPGPRDLGTMLELVPPGAALPPPPRTRANVPLDPVAGGPGDPELVRPAGLFSAPEPVEARPFSRSDAARVTTDAVVSALRARGEPATFEQLLGQVLVALDRTGLLRRYAIASERDAGDADAQPRDDGTAEPGPVLDGPETVLDGRVSEPRRGTTTGPGQGTAEATAAEPASDPVERLLALVGDELRRPSQRRVVEIAPGRWWLADRVDRESAAAPLADRIEWATYSLLSTAGPLSESAFRDRVRALFTGADLPDEAIVEACLESYRSPTSTPERLTTNDDLAARAHEHAELIALLAETGHRLGLDVWISATEQRRRLGARTLADWLEPAERTAYLGGIAGARTDALEQVDVAWYVRGRLALLFEVEWTAILGETLLGRHALIPADDRVVRFLVVPGERAELLRAKLASPLFSSIVDTQNWHVLKWNHLRTFAALERPSIDGLEPFVGLDPPVERSGEQLPLFALPEASEGAGTSRPAAAAAAAEPGAPGARPTEA